MCSSPSGYNFLRKQNLLPLPCVKSIRTHLLALKHERGFDVGFFKLLKKKFEEKNEYQKKGVLLLDEIFLRTSLNVKTRTLSYSGLEDFGGEIEKKNCKFRIS